MQKERKEYTNRKILGKDTNIKCSDVSSMNSNDYGTCVITFDNTGKAKVSITGKGKFEGYTCNGNSTNMKCVKGEIPGPTETAAQYFAYSEVEGGVIVKDKNKCVAYLQGIGATEEEANTLCSGNALDDGMTLKDGVQRGKIPSSDYETAGLEVTYNTAVIITGYNVGVPSVEVKDKNKCVAYLLNFIHDTSDEAKQHANTVCSGGAVDGTTLKDFATKEIPPEDYENAGLCTIYENGGGPDVVIPSTIDGKKVTGIGETAFAGEYIPNAVGSYYYAGLGLTSVVIPNTITNIWESAFG